MLPLHEQAIIRGGACTYPTISQCSKYHCDCYYENGYKFENNKMERPQPGWKQAEISALITKYFQQPSPFEQG